MIKNGFIAATMDENGDVFQHFGHTRLFAVCEIKEGLAVDAKVIDAEGSGHSALGGFLKDNKIDVLICGGIGGGARNVLAAAGIELIAGVTGSVKDAFTAYLAGNLQDGGAVCDHHHSHEDMPQGECRGCGHGRHSCE